MKKLKRYIQEKQLDTEYKEIVKILEFVGGLGNAGQLYSGQKSKTKREQDQENMQWSNRHGYRDGKIWHDIFTRDYSGTIYGRLRQFFKNWFKNNAGFDLDRGVSINTDHVTSVPASTKELSYLINGTREVKKTTNKKTGIDDVKAPRKESLDDNIIHYRNCNFINEDGDEEQNSGEKGPTGFPGLEALTKSNNKFALDKENSINVYMDEEKRPLGVSIISAPSVKSLQKFREECGDEKYKECSHIYHLEFLRGLEDQWPKFFKDFVMKDIEKQFEIKKASAKEKKEIKDEIKKDDDGLPPATDRTITISFLDGSFEKLYASLGFKTYDKKNNLMVGVL